MEKLGDEELEPVLRVLRADEPSNQSASRSDPQSINPQSDTEPSEVAIRLLRIGVLRAGIFLNSTDVA